MRYRFDKLYLRLSFLKNPEEKQNIALFKTI